MPYNHSYDRQLLIPASFECFSLSELHQVDGANAPAYEHAPTPTPYCMHTLKSFQLCYYFRPFLSSPVLLSHITSQLLINPPFSFLGLRTPPPAPLLLRGTELWLCLNRWCFRLDRHVKRRFKSDIHGPGEEDSATQSHTAVAPKKRVEIPGLWAVGFVVFRGCGVHWFLKRKCLNRAEVI